MSIKKSIILIATWIVSVTSILGGATPSADYLTQFPLKKIESTINTQGDASFPFATYVPFFQEVTANEGPGFFGYHATTRAHLIYQMIVRITLEELYGYQFPADFYFLRIPGGSQYNIKNIQTLFQDYGRPRLDTAGMRTFINLFLLSPLRQATQVSLPSKSIRDDQLPKLYEALLTYAPVMPSTAMSQKKALSVIRSALDDIMRTGSQKNQTVYDALARWARNPVTFRDRNEVMANDEDEKLVFNQIYPFDDSKGTLQDLLVSCNIALYAHFTLPTESTMHIYAHGTSIELNFGKEVHGKLQQFYRELGLDSSLIDVFIAKSKECFPNKGGVLLQFFDRTEGSLDRVAYTSENFGKPDKATPPSKAAFSFNPRNFQEVISPKSKKRAILHQQLRLLMTNQETLNPFSWLRIKYYTPFSQESQDTFASFVREQVREAPVDTTRSTKYGNMLQEQWGVGK